MRTNLRQQYHVVNQLLPIPPVGCQCSLAEVASCRQLERDGAERGPCRPIVPQVATDWSVSWFWAKSRPVANDVAADVVAVVWPRWGHEAAGIRTAWIIALA